MALPSESSALRTLRCDVPYWEFPGGGERYAEDSTEVTRRLACYWRDRERFLMAVLGDAFISGDAGLPGAKLRRHLPERHPDFDSNDLGSGCGVSGSGNAFGFFPLWASEAQFLGGAGWPGRSDSGSGSGSGPGVGAIAYHDSPPRGAPSAPLRAANGEGLAIYDVTYRPTRYEVLDDAEADAETDKELSRWTYVTREPSAENLPWPQNFLEFKTPDSDGRRRQQPALAPRIFAAGTVNLNWLMVPQAAYRTKTVEGYWSSGLSTGEGDFFIQGAVGAVNATTFLGYNPETLLMLPPTVRLYVHANTGVFIDVTFHMQYRPQTFQTVLRNTGHWAQMRRKFDPTNGPFLRFEFKDCFDVSKL